MQLAIVIPTYNELENVGNLVPLLFRLYPDCHVWIADDGSPDGTGDLVERLAKTHRELHLIRRTKKQGIGRAYLHGFSEILKDGRADLIVQMDADFSHNPEVIAEMIKMAENADLVVGSRYLTGISVINWPLSRVLLSYFANMYVRWVTRIPVRDATGGFKCWRKQTLAALDFGRITSDGYSFQIEMNYAAWRLGFRVVEVPIIFIDRTLGQSKMSKRIVVEALTKVLKLPFRTTRSFGSKKP